MVEYRESERERARERERESEIIIILLPTYVPAGIKLIGPLYTHSQYRRVIEFLFYYSN